MQKLALTRTMNCSEQRRFADGLGIGESKAIRIASMHLTLNLADLRHFRGLFFVRQRWIDQLRHLAQRAARGDRSPIEGTHALQ